MSEIIHRLLDAITLEDYDRIEKGMDVWSHQYVYSDWYDVDFTWGEDEFDDIYYHLRNIDIKYCLPYRESIQRSNIYAQTWDARRKSEYHKIDGYYPYKRIERILENNVGKSFDRAFSYYCRKSPKYQQKLFEETINRNWSRRWGKDYIVDENGLIQGNPDRHKKWYNWINPPYKVKSWDHKGENQWIHNITGQIGFEPYSWEDAIEFRKKHKFKYITTQGKIYEFQSKDYRYYRCKKEQEQKRKKYNRQLPD